MGLLTSSNVQIYPSKIRIIPNDKIGKSFFNLSFLAFDSLVNGKVGNITELKNFKKVGSIRSAINIKVSDDFSITEPFDLFDCSVLSVCISEWVKGNFFTTPTIIYRGLTGKVGRGDAEPSSSQYDDILTSVEKLMRIQASFDLSQYSQFLGDGNSKKFVSTILPSQYLQNTTINGKPATIINFTAESPLLSIAKFKNNQLLSFDASLLDIPHQQNTRLNIIVKTFAFIRVFDIINHKLTPVITFDDFYQKCRIENVHCEVQRRARDSLLGVLEHLKSKKVIKNFLVEKKGRAFRAVKIFYCPKQLDLTGTANIVI